MRLSISEHAIRLARDDDSKVHVIPLNGVTLSSLHKNVSRQYAACVILHNRKKCAYSRASLPISGLQPSAFVVEGLSLKALENKDQKQGRHTILTKTDSEVCALLPDKILTTQ